MIALTDQPIDVRAVEAAVAHPGAGAVCTFQGVVRDHHLGREVSFLQYEAYAAMAEAALADIAEQIAARWPGTRTAIVHRLGRLAIGEASVVIAVSHAHRAAAFEACRYAIDTLKTTVPIWKKETRTDGEAWVEGTALAPLAAASLIEPSTLSEGEEADAKRG
jgi:molybdopterin synthase catalytic subunit